MKLPTHTTVSLLRMTKDVFELRGFYDALAWSLLTEGGRDQNKLS
jgi:hypothetical protein